MPTAAAEGVDIVVVEMNVRTGPRKMWIVPSEVSVYQAVLLYIYNKGDCNCSFANWDRHLLTMLRIETAFRIHVINPYYL